MAPAERAGPVPTSDTPVHGVASGDATQVGRGPRAAGPDAGAPGLLVVSSPLPALIGAFFPLRGDELVVGRGAEADVRVEDGGISRRHLRIALGPGGEVVAHDLGSTNGTFVNGVKVRSAVLAHGDRIHLGTGTELVFGPPGQAGAEEVRLRQALAASGVGAWEWDAASGQLTFSGGIAREAARGLESTEPQRDELWARMHEADRAALRERLRGLASAGDRLELELRLRRGDGGWAWLAMKGVAFADEARRILRVAGTVMDVTDRRRAEEELRRQSLLLDSLSDGVMAVGLDGAIIEWNARAAGMLGWSRAEAVGQRPHDLLTPGRRDGLGEATLARALAGERVAEERMLRRQDGREVAVEVVAVPLTDAEGRRVACVAILRDVDERRRMLARLQISERLASLGTLSAGLAHEINNPLAFVIANLSWVKTRLADLAGAVGPAWPEVEAALADCREGAERIRTIVQDLGIYASSAPRTEAGPSDVVGVLEFALRVADNEVRNRARVVKELRPVPKVQGGHARLGQVFLNLLVNAAQAIEPGRVEENRVRVATRYDEASGRVLVEIEDSGAGMDRETAARIFDPFFTTKPVGTGTGLGLSICHGIVEALGGEIEVESEPGKGTTFRVWLKVAAPLPAAERSRARVLVVDDEPLLCLSMQRLLSQRHEVVACTDPREALRQVELGQRFDAVILDLAMPQMHGMAFLARLREAAPALAERVLVVHGGTLDEATQDALEARGIGRLAKPFDMEHLARLVDGMVALPRLG